jgi:hypothetical protein
MLKISARSKLLNLQHSVKLYYILAIGAFITVLTFLLYRDFVVSATMLVSTVAAFIILGRPPAKLIISIGPEGLGIGDEVLKWQDCLGWALTDLGDNLEFTIQTTQFSQQFYYFYLETDQLGVAEFIEAISNFLPYSEEVAGKNLIHSILCTLGLR